jgi:hypothetical protein
MKAIPTAILLCATATLWFVHPTFSHTKDLDAGPAIISCAMYEASGPWVHANRYPGSMIRFNYSHEGPDPKPGADSYNDATDYLYAAFWNHDRTAGEFLQFIWFRKESKTHLRIVNNANIISSNGHLDLEDVLWGSWTYEHLKGRLQQLRAAPTETFSLAKVEDAHAVCDSYAHPNPDTVTESSGSK